MAFHRVLHTPLRRRLEHFHLEIEHGFQLVPEQLEDALVRCRMCRLFHTCGDDLVSRYLICPNRGVRDRLNDLLGE